MSIIKVLPENLVNQIAAGEVVERPASVVKELVENSIDAGADRVLVEVRDAGKSLIKIVDNGKGMSREDCELALQRHATSKLAEEGDLWNIRTMGFRGEALASIASVAKIVLRSKREEDMAGSEINCEGGEIVNIAEVGMSKGTQIEVHDLFFNTPAREKYLKKESTELRHITVLLNKIALATPGLALKFVHNEKVVFDYPKVTDLLARISDVFGKATAEAMLPIFYAGSDFELDGYIGKPLLARSSGKHQYFFVNGRPIQHYLFAHTVKRAFHSMLMEHKKPMFLINIKISPALIDVNVHPRKIEIRFEDEQGILRILYGAVKKSLEKNSLMPKGFTESQRYMSDKMPVEEPVQARESFSFPKAESPVQNALSFSKKFMSERDMRPLEVEREEDDSMRAIVQVKNSYIVAQNEEGLVLIDQHAAHERVRYEELMKQFADEKKLVQPLLVPQQLEFSHDELQLLEANMDLFKGLGFEIEPFGGNTFVVSALPSCLAKEDIVEVIQGVLDDVAAGKNPSNMQGRIEEMLTYMSCRSAIKFGQRLDMPEMEALIKQLDKVDHPYTCPHGRPTMVKLTLEELGKMFGRK